MSTRADLLKRFGRDWLKPLSFWLLALPGLWLGWQWWALLTGAEHALGFNPIETTHRFLGDTALRILILSLAITPFRDLTRWTPVMKIRRRVGLAAFWYALLHLLAYMGLDLLVAAQGNVPGMFAGLWNDVVERIYITLGMFAVIGLVPLALTSFNSSIRALGAHLWQRLHLAVYPIAVLAVFHYGFMVKGHQLGPWVHGGVLGILLVYRIVHRLRKVQARNRSAA
ncbi:sulfite oxidase heme-binding subunit YedZ [Maricaulis sp.]|uniref:sulfite oxidase heme-binding subunit YedZ n=1 Tax=Maricaulis sp. TaxID=1486257 RepID=UPI001B09F8BE|nr:protein-methionine-sulfoxide reductase heme-binding subunit MsrQ [Maricaulis sp.]MBO6797866.1 sulfoxide reductase heme-binding subunit YedZ [Maricaulis sp.]